MDTEDTPLEAILMGALAEKRRHEGLVHVVKASGKIVDNTDIRRQFVEQVIMMRRDLGMKVVVIHGAGKQIDAMLEAAGKKSEKRDGLRLSRADHIEIIDAATRAVNAELCDTFNQIGAGTVTPVSLSGYTDGLSMLAHAKDASGDNFSGDTVESFDAAWLHALLAQNGRIPVITNMCGNADSAGTVRKINVNADAVASKIATGLKAHRLLMCSDTPGVRGRDGNIIQEMGQAEIDSLSADGTINGGMLVKVQEALATAGAMGDGAAVTIMDHHFLVELLTPRGRGTMIRAAQPKN